MNRREIIQAQIAEMDHLINLSEGDPLTQSQFRDRRQELSVELEELPVIAQEPRAALLFAGGPVFGSAGIDAQFAAKVMQPFVGMVKTQYAAMAHGRVG